MKQTGTFKLSQTDLDQNAEIATKAEQTTLAALLPRMAVVEDRFDWYSKSEVDAFLAAFNAYMAEHP